MGGNASHLSDDGYDRTVKSLTPEEISILVKQFQDLAARSPNPDLIDKQTFLRFLPLPGMLGERLFHVADLSQNGGIDLEEFITLMAILVRGSPEVRTKMLYDMYNFSADTSGIVFLELVAMINSTVFANPSSDVFRTRSGTIHQGSSGPIPNLSGQISPTNSSLGSNSGPTPIQMSSSSSGSASASLSTTPPGSAPIFGSPPKYSFPGKSQLPNSPQIVKRTLSDEQSAPLDSQAEVAKIVEEMRQIDSKLENCSVQEMTELFTAKHHLETKLAKMGHNALEEYRKGGNSLHDTLSRIAQRALENYDTDRSGKLSYDQFKDWVSRNPIVMDSVFNNYTISQLSERLNRLPTITPMKGGNRPLSPDNSLDTQDQLHGHLYRPSRILQRHLRKFYVLQDGFLYEFKSLKSAQGDHPKPDDAIYLEGASITLPQTTPLFTLYEQIYQIEHERDSAIRRQEDHAVLVDLNAQRATLMSEASKLEKEESDEEGKLEIQVKLPHRRLFLFASSEKERAEWFVALSRAAQDRKFEDFYEVDYESVLGKGAFAMVYKCREIATGEVFAVKVIDTSQLNKDELKTLDTELSCMNLVRHPNVVSKKDVFETDSRVYLVLELLEGGTIIDRINKSGIFKAELAQRVTLDILKGLSYLHDAGIIHRDLKPSNIVFVNNSEDSVVKILDFGFSAFTRPQDLFTQPVGTLKYFAPELIRGQGYNAQVDMWCVGVILYVMLTAKFPFNGDTEAQLFDNIENVRYDRNSETWRAVPDPAKNLIKRLLKYDPGQRLTVQEALAHPWMKL